MSSILLDGENTLAVRVNQYSSGSHIEALDAAGHTVDLVPDDSVWLTLDVAQHALRTAACGPLPQEKYVLSARPFQLGVTFSLSREG